MLKVVDEQAIYEQWAGFDRPYRLRLYRGPAGPAVVVVTAEPFTTWLVRYGPDLAAHVCARQGLDPRAVRWVSAVPGADPADPALVEALTTGASYTYCTFGPQPDAPGQLRYLVCEPVTRAWVERVLLGCDLDDGGFTPPSDADLHDRVARLVRGPAGDVLRDLGILTVPLTLEAAPDAAGTSATPASSPIAASAARHRCWRRRWRAGDGAR